MKRILSSLIALILCLSLFAVSAAADETAYPFTLSFAFVDEDHDTLDRINGVLASMPLYDLDIASPKGYAREETLYDGFGDVVDVKAGYNITSITLECNQRAESGPYVYQIDAAAYRHTENMQAEAFHSLWSGEHPDLVIRQLLHISIGDFDVFLFAYHQRPAN